MQARTEVDEILRVPPAKLRAYSTIFVSLGLLVFLTIGILVSIPEESSGKVSLFNGHAFVNICANESGRVAKLFVKDKESVREGDFLVLINNPLAYPDYQSLNIVLGQLDSLFMTNDTLALASATIPGLNKLGSMQSSYQELQKRLQQFSAHIISN